LLLFKCWILRELAYRTIIVPVMTLKYEYRVTGNVMIVEPTSTPAVWLTCGVRDGRINTFYFLARKNQLL